MTARIEFLLGLVALIIAGLTTTLYRRTELRRQRDGGGSLVSRIVPSDAVTRR